MYKCKYCDCFVKYNVVYCPFCGGKIIRTDHLKHLAISLNYNERYR